MNNTHYFENGKGAPKSDLPSGSKLLAHFQFCPSETSNPQKARFSLIAPPTACFNPFRVSESLAMPSSIPAAKRECVKVKSVLGLSSKVSQKQANLALRTVQRIHTHLKHSNGSARAHKASHKDRPCVIMPEMEEVLAFDLHFVADITKA